MCTTIQFFKGRTAFVLWNLLIRLNFSRLNSLTFFLLLFLILSLSFAHTFITFSLFLYYSFIRTSTRPLILLLFFFSGEEPGYRYHRCFSLFKLSNRLEHIADFKVEYITFFFILYYFLWQTNVSNYYSYVWILSLAYPYHKTELISPYHSLLGIIVKLSILPRSSSTK